MALRCNRGGRASLLCLPIYLAYLSSVPLVTRLVPQKGVWHSVTTLRRRLPVSYSINKGPLDLSRQERHGFFEPSPLFDATYATRHTGSQATRQGHGRGCSPVSSILCTVATDLLVQGRHRAKARSSPPWAPLLFSGR